MTFQDPYKTKKSSCRVANTKSAKMETNIILKSILIKNNTLPWVNPTKGSSTENDQGGSYLISSWIIHYFCQ